MTRSICITNKLPWPDPLIFGAKFFCSVKLRLWVDITRQQIIAVSTTISVSLSQRWCCADHGFPVVISRAWTRSPIWPGRVRMQSPHPFCLSHIPLRSQPPLPSRNENIRVQIELRHLLYNDDKHPRRVCFWANIEIIHTLLVNKNGFV